MTVQLDLDPEFVKRLTAEADAHGMGLEAYAIAKLREAVGPHFTPGAVSNEQLFAMLSSIAEGAEKLPRLRTSTFSRESFYEERS